MVGGDAMSRQLSLQAITAEIPGISAAAQRLRLATALELLGSITTFEAMRHLDIYDPRPRKLEPLAAGYNITLSWDQTVTESGETHRVGRYVLKGIPEGKM